MDSINKQLEGIGDYLTRPELWITIGQAALKIVVIILLATFVIRISSTIIDKLFNRKKHGPIQISERRENTLTRLINSIIKYTVYFTAFIMILAALGLEIMPLLAGAGVAGIAIGFGAQSLVKDIISGFFIVFEDQFSVGDYIKTTEVEGTVEEIGLRTTKIKSWTGEQHIIPNGNITRVTNYSIHNGLAVVDINIPYENDIETAEGLIEEILADLPNKYEQILSVPVIHGVQSLELSHIVIRVIAETLPVYQWSGARAIRKEIKERLYKEGIDIPAPRLVMYSHHNQPTSMEMRESDKE